MSFIPWNYLYITKNGIAKTGEIKCLRSYKYIKLVNLDFSLRKMITDLRSFHIKIEIMHSISLSTFYEQVNIPIVFCY